ncbi:MAG: hypothetical protein HYZ59_02520 [Actinobacteria bacterium]|nr:hypothetical protein [Actinomycetota bacterium]
MRDVQRAVMARRGEALEAAAVDALRPGLVLGHLGPLGALGALEDEGDRTSPGSLGGVISVGGLSRLSNDELPTVLALVRASLAPGGRLWFVDHGGCTHGVWGFVASRIGHRTFAEGLHPERSLPECIRHAGFIITDIERFAMPTRNRLLRPWVQGVAVVASRTTGSSS